jgi:hypothetical protein
MEFQQMTLTLGHYDPAHLAVLSLSNTTLGDLNIVDASTPVPTWAYAEIDVAGHVAFNGTIASTALGEDLTVRLAPHSTLTNIGFIRTDGPDLGGRVQFVGGNGSTLINNILIDPVHSGVAKVDVDVKGNGGQWGIALGGAHYNDAGSSTLEFGKSVSNGQSVLFSGEATAVTPETLRLDRPGDFHAMISDFGANDTIDLHGASVNAGRLLHHGQFDNVWSELQLFAGKHEVADLKLWGYYDPGQFDVARSGGASLIDFNGADTSHQIVMGGSRCITSDGSAAGAATRSRPPVSASQTRRQRQPFRLLRRVVRPKPRRRTPLNSTVCGSSLTGLCHHAA